MYILYKKIPKLPKPFDHVVTMLTLKLINFPINLKILNFRV